jgi:hypothetical protein
VDAQLRILQSVPNGTDADVRTDEPFALFKIMDRVPLREPEDATHFGKFDPAAGKENGGDSAYWNQPGNGVFVKLLQNDKRLLLRGPSGID